MAKPSDQVLLRTVSRGTMVAPVENMTLPKRILVPVDFSEASRRALELAAKVAQACDAQLDVVHVVEVVDHMSARVTIDAAGGERVEFVEWSRQRAEGELGEFIARAESVQVANRTVLTGAPSRSIVELARTGGYDLIVMGKHGRSLLDRLLIGSVAERVLRRSPCSVLAVPEAQH